MTPRHAIGRFLAGSAGVCALWVLVSPWWVDFDGAYAGMLTRPSVSGLPMFGPPGQFGAVPFGAETVHRGDLPVVLLGAILMILAAAQWGNRRSRLMLQLSGVMVGGLGVVAMVFDRLFIDRGTLEYGPFLALGAGLVALLASVVQPAAEVSRRARGRTAFVPALMDFRLDVHIVPGLVEWVRAVVAAVFGGTTLAVVLVGVWETFSRGAPSETGGLWQAWEPMLGVLALLVGGGIFLGVGLIVLRVTSELVVIPFRIHDELTRGPTPGPRLSDEELAHLPPPPDDG